MENNQNSSNNEGVGTVGNNVNIQYVTKQSINDLLEKFVKIDKFEKEVEPLIKEKNDLKDKIVRLQDGIKVIKRIIKGISMFIALSLILGVISICISLPVFSADSMGFLGWTAAVLSMLVVILMGWQIFNIIDLKGVREDINKIEVLSGRIDGLEDKLRKKIERNYIDDRIDKEIDKLRDYVNNNFLSQILVNQDEHELFCRIKDDIKNLSNKLEKVEQLIK